MSEMKFAFPYAAFTNLQTIKRWRNYRHSSILVLFEQWNSRKSPWQAMQPRALFLLTLCITHRQTLRRCRRRILLHRKPHGLRRRIQRCSRRALHVLHHNQRTGSFTRLRNTRRSRHFLRSLVIPRPLKNLSFRRVVVVVPRVFEEFRWWRRIWDGRLIIGVFQSEGLAGLGGWGGERGCCGRVYDCPECGVVEVLIVDGEAHRWGHFFCGCVWDWRS